MDIVTGSGNIYANEAYITDTMTGCLGVCPVVTMSDGVYIASGTGTDTDPYVLAKE